MESDGIVARADAARLPAARRRRPWGERISSRVNREKESSHALGRFPLICEEHSRVFVLKAEKKERKWLDCGHVSVDQRSADDLNENCVNFDAVGCLREWRHLWWRSSSSRASLSLRWKPKSARGPFSTTQVRRPCAALSFRLCERHTCNLATRSAGVQTWRVFQLFSKKKNGAVHSFHPNCRI